MCPAKGACVVCRSHSELFPQGISHGGLYAGHDPVMDIVDHRPAYGKGEGEGGVIVPGPLSAWADRVGLGRDWLWNEKLGNEVQEERLAKTHGEKNVKGQEPDTTTLMASSQYFDVDESKKKKEDDDKEQVSEKLMAQDDNDRKQEKPEKAKARGPKNWMEKLARGPGK